MWGVKAWAPSPSGGEYSLLPGTLGGLQPALAPFPAWSVLLPASGPLSSPAPPLQRGPWQPSPHWLHVTLETGPRRANRPQGSGQNGSSLRTPSPCTAMRDLCTTQSQAYWQERIQKETTARVTWKINYGHKYLKEGPVPRKRLQRAPLRLALGAGPLPATSAPESKEIRDGWPETKGVQDQLSKGVGVQGPPPKGEKAWEAQRDPRGPAVQTRPGVLEMRQVPASTLRLLFQGISHDGQGRASYLRERHRQKPEEKFLYPVLSSWEYGWHMGKGCHHLATPGLCWQAWPSLPPPQPCP